MVVISPITIPEDGRVYESSNVQLKIDDTQLSTGSLYITNNFLLWQGDGRNDGISIPWTRISLHAISIDPVKCVYFILDYRLLWPNVVEHRNGNSNGNSSENDDEVDEGNYEDDDEEMTQMWLIPCDAEEVDKIYNAMIQCQILNPDPNDSLSEEEEFMEALDENVEELDPEEMQNLNIDDGRYDDANED
ncbi:Methylosome subunit pICln [Pseudolycoriella hygida]|uniref:Methylosome subunit pICln n=1 Tax=Pseudolycoriella hygida TaxID=35572 RepID=A0A9Q0NEK9_9DIPT|nr:Methylosome subunit pICln [Pseudolycoriella hygida]